MRTFSMGDAFADYFAASLSNVRESVDDYVLGKILAKGGERIHLTPSKLPACSILLTQEALIRRQQKQDYEQHGTIPMCDSDMGGETFAGMGTLRHAITQDYLGMGGKILGDWKCTKCGHIHSMCLYKACTKCGAAMSYVELKRAIWREHNGRKYKVLGLSLDGLFVHDGKVWVIDYKFCTDNKFKSGLPDTHHRIQLSTYFAALKHLFRNSGLGEKLVGFKILYVAFDTLALKTYTKNRKWYVHSERVGPKKLKRINAFLEQQYQSVLLANDVADRTFASKRVTTKDLRSIISDAPCTDFDYYKQHMEGYDGCEYATSSGCFGKKREAAIKEGLLNNIEA